MAKPASRYAALLETIFFDSYKKGVTEFEFEREDLSKTANKIGVEIPKNLGDVIYSMRFRTPMPQKVIDTQPKKKEWIISLAGHGCYRFRLVPIVRIIPNPNLIGIKIPDATPEVVSAYSLSDEQALLAKVRYNRLLDIFLGAATYSIQNHLRTTVKGMGQIEIDEIYVGVDSGGCQYVLPVQAKGGSDRLSIVQAEQDIQCCAEKFPYLICRPISVQFMEDDLIALFELTMEKDIIKIVEERHYRLVSSDKITREDLLNYGRRQ